MAFEAIDNRNCRIHYLKESQVGQSVDWVQNALHLEPPLSSMFKTHSSKDLLAALDKAHPGRSLDTTAIILSHEHIEDRD
ncbi:hypothetical protein [Bradyrhizobium sp. WSM2793]|uniref:hypothetical protein n=1 Tax=Bradyrhizobium sp. WSM2793 TaxID=1038866 RepID=UPI00036EBA69|nr:hypothetical protein [Bradyrhizobium sp. WSM2793]